MPVIVIWALTEGFTSLARKIVTIARNSCGALMAPARAPPSCGDFRLPGAIEDVTQRREAEREKDELLRQKDVLLEEMQHRGGRSLGKGNHFSPQRTSTL